MVSEATEETAANQAGSYTTVRHLLSAGANDTTDAGEKAYNNILDNKITVESIYAKGGKYAKCKPEKKVKEDIDKEHYYKLAFENQVGSYVSGGYYDNKGQHHGAVHLVEKFYKKYQVYSQVYSYTVTNDTEQTVDYYYFIYIWRELIDDDYHKSSDADYLTYCLQYGTSISKTDAAYAKEKQTYDALKEEDRYKVACAIYYGPHRASDGQYYTTLKKKLQSESEGYNPSTWSKTMWLRYAATQFYIWTVTNPAKFSHADAVATAKQFDGDYFTENESCYRFYLSLKSYAENAAKLPRFMTDDSETSLAETLSLQADGSYAVTLYDDNAVLKTGTFSCDNDDVTIQVESDKKLTLKSGRQILSAKLKFQKTEQVPDGKGLWYYANEKSQNMVDSVVSVMDCYGYVQLKTSDIDDTPLKVRKVGATTGRSYANAGYAVFTSWASAAVYNPETKTAMVDSNGKPLQASNYIAGLIYQTAVGQPWNFTTYSTAKEEELKNAGCNVKTLYHLAYYIQQGHTSSVLPSTYCISTDDTGWAATGKVKRRLIDGQDVTYYGYYMIEYQAPEHCDPAYPVKVANGCLVEGTCCLKWNTIDDYNQSAKTQTDIEHAGSLKIYKYEADSMVPLKDVVFHIYEDAECTRLYRKIVTGGDGYAIADQVPPGSYYVKEYQGQKIHVTDYGVTEVQVSPDVLTVIDKSNTPIAVRICLQKKADTSSFPKDFLIEDYSVAGAEYTLYAAQDIIGSNGTVLYRKDEAVYIMVCDENGYATVPIEFAKAHLRLGSYYVKETKAPYGYELDKTRYKVEAWSPETTSLIVSDDGDEFSGNQSVYNIWVDVAAEQPVKKSIRLHKSGRNLDYGGNWHRGNLEGAVFAVYRVEKMVQDGLDITEDNFKDIPYEEGDYDKYRVTINEDKAKPYCIVTDVKGNAETEMLLAGDYVVVELEAPVGYELAEPIWISLPEDAGKDYAYTEVEDRMLTGTIEISKIGDMPIQAKIRDTAYGTLHELLFEKRALAGVEFAIYDEELKEIERLTTKSDGTAISRELPLGTYYVQESKTFDGLVLDRQYYMAQITVDKEHKVIDAHLNPENDITQAELVIYKTGDLVVPSADSGFSIAVQPLEGVTFGVYNKTDILSAEGHVLLPAGTLLGLAATNEHGEAVISAKLLPGDYYYQELRTLEGYEINAQQFDFSLSLSSNQPVERIELNRENPLVNHYYQATVRLRKVDATQTELSLKGVEFELYDASTNECVGYYTTDENGEIKIDNMPYGCWYFKETKPLPGYQVDTARYSFEISEMEQTVDLIVENYPEINLAYEEAGKYGIIFGLCLIAGITFLIMGARKKNGKDKLE